MSGARPSVVVYDYGSGNVHSAVKALELAGADVELTSDRTRALEADGLLATCIQHEIDHLDGILYPDRMAPDAKLYRVDDEELDEETAALAHS